MAFAQVADDFSDGDLTHNPTWTGTTNRWVVASLNDNPALRSAGLAASDTLYLATPSTTSRGSWSFTFTHQATNLSNFNGVRVYLTADTDSLPGAVWGYYLQLGASNSDEVRLYRQDGDPMRGRVLLGQSATPLLDGEGNTLTITVTRSETFTWRVLIADTPILTATDDTYTTSHYFGLWVKHTPPAAQGYFFDNIVVQGDTGAIDTDPEGPAPEPGDLIINEVYYDPPDAALEFVEIYNRSNKTLNLQHLRLADERLQSVSLTEVSSSLPPGDYATLVREASAFGTAFPGIPFIEVPGWPALNNSGDAAVLFFEDTILDAVTFTPRWGGDGVSLERKDPNGPSDSRFNFGSSMAEGGATPGTRNSLFAPDLTPPTLLFAEQTDVNTIDVFLDEPIAPESIHPQAFSLDNEHTPASIFIDEEATVLHLRFDTSPTGTRLRVNDLRDLTGNTLVESTIDIAFLPQPGDLIINEIMYDPRADPFDQRPDQPEYVELFNRSPHLLTLRNQYWTDFPDENNHADTLYLGTDFFAIYPDRFAVIFPDPEPSTDPKAGTLLTDAFPNIDVIGGVTTLIPQPRSTLGLVNTGRLIALHRRDGTILDTVQYAPTWHHPNLIDATGISLERITPTSPANDPTAWTSSVATAGGTPGQANSIGLPPSASMERHRLVVEPTPFSPDRDGHDDVTAIRYTLDQETSLIRVRIFDARGRLVRSLENAYLAGRTGQLLWDGLDDAGHDLRIGIYIIYFEALDTQGGITTALKKPVVLARPLG